MKMAKPDPFDTHSEQYDHWFDAHRAAYISELLALRMLVPWDGHELEIGVGTGRSARPLGVAIGLDPSDAMLSRAAAPGVETTKGIAEALPSSDGSFDYALIVTTIGFVGSPDKMLAEAYRVLRPNSKFTIGFINRESGIRRGYLARQSENVSIGRPCSIPQPRWTSGNEIGVLALVRGDRRCFAHWQKFRRSNRFVRALVTAPFS